MGGCVTEAASRWFFVTLSFHICFPFPFLDVQALCPKSYPSKSNSHCNFSTGNARCWCNSQKKTTAKIIPVRGWLFTFPLNLHLIATSSPNTWQQTYPILRSTEH